MYFVYIVRCADRTFYTGTAHDVLARIEVHNGGRGARYTRSRLPVRVVYVEPAHTRGAALSREYALKQLTRAEKTEFIRRARAKTRRRLSALRVRAARALE